MSIIHDALKKTKDSIQPPQDNPPETPSPEVAAVLKKKRTANRIKWFIFYLLAVAISLYMGNIPFNLAGKEKNLLKNHTLAWPAAKKQVKTKTSQEKDASVLKKVTLVPDAKKEADALVLNGIFFSGEEGYALINNQIVKAGEVVNGATVREINKEDVTLEAKGETFKLSTR